MSTGLRKTYDGSGGGRARVILQGIDWGDANFRISVDVLSDTLAGSPYATDPTVRDIMQALQNRPSGAEFGAIVERFNRLPQAWRVELRDSAEMIARLRGTMD